MKKFIATLVAATVLATATVGLSTQAQANDVGLGIAAGVLGGVVVGQALADQRHRDDEDYYYRHHHRHYVEEDVVVCKKVLYEDDYGHRYWKKNCH